MGWHETRKSSKWWLAGLLGAVAIKLWLVQGLFLAARTYYFDDLLYLDHGRWLINGQWLGAFDATTLVKGPGYPLWIAFSFFSSIPLLLSQHLLYIAACALLAHSLRPLVQQRYAMPALLFLALLFDPQSYSPYNERVVRDFLYATQHLFILAGLVGLITRRDRFSSMLGWALGLGFWLGFFWITREEGILVLPAVALLLLYAGWLIWREQGARRLPRLTLLGLPLVVMAVITTTVCAINYRQYGIFAVVEQKTATFQEAMAALQRVKQQDWQRYIPLPQETRLKIYAASPAFAELRPHLEGEIGQQWTEMSASRLPELASRPDIGGGWYLWAILDSVQAAGHYASGQAARQYYARLEAEVNAACGDGRLSCYPPGQSAFFRQVRDVLPHIWRSSVELAGYLASYQQNEPSQTNSQLNNNDEYLLFLDIPMSNLAPSPGQQAPTVNQNRLNAAKLGALRKIYSCYQAVAPWLYALTMASLLLAGLGCLWRRNLPPLFMVSLAILSIIVLRLLGLAYIDAMACSAKPYLGPIYPLAIALAFLLGLSLVEMASAWRKTRRHRVR